MKLEGYQINAVNSLRELYLNKWDRKDVNNFTVFLKAPTGAGKTVIAGSFMEFIAKRDNVVFLWMSFNESICIQSMESINDKFPTVNGRDYKSIMTDSFNPSDALFINYQKLITKLEKDRKLRAKSDKGITFDERMAEIRGEGNKIVLIIDESHLHSNTEKVVELISNVIKPRLILNISATPTLKGEDCGFVEVKRADVVESQRIREKLVFQTEEEILSVKDTNVTTEVAMAELAFRKRLELKTAYAAEGENINPLVLIQLPAKELGEKLMGDVVAHLKKLGVEDNEIAAWTSKDNEHVKKSLDTLKGISDRNNPISFLFFVQSLATGFDCPRAQILIGYKSIKGQTYMTQVLGRIYRSIDGKWMTNPILNRGYVYTNHNLKDIPREEAIKMIDDFDADFYTSECKDELSKSKLWTTVKHRSSQNDLGAYDIYYNIIMNKEFDEEYSFKTDYFVPDTIISDYEIENLDNILQYGGETKIDCRGTSLTYHVEKELQEFLNGEGISAVRATPKFYKGISSFIREAIGGGTQDQINKAILYEFRENRRGKFCEFIEQTVAEAISERTKNETTNKFTDKPYQFPCSDKTYGKDYKKFDMKKYVHKTCYLKEVSDETEFAKYIDSNEHVECWDKNGQVGTSYYSINYDDSENNERLFFPDFIVRTNSGKVLILELKKANNSMSAGSDDTKQKANALYRRIRDNNVKEEYAKIEGGIVVYHKGVYKIFKGKSYTSDMSSKNWIDLDTFIAEQNAQ